MKAIYYPIVLASLLGLAGVSHAASIQVKQLQCAGMAVEQAKKLLAFHVGSEANVTIDPQTKLLPPMANPKFKKQKFEVIEAWGSVNQDRYRMHLIFFPQDAKCTLMGQEIIEFAKPS